MVWDTVKEQALLFHSKPKDIDGCKKNLRGLLRKHSVKKKKKKKVIVQGPEKPTKPVRCVCKCIVFDFGFFHFMSE